VAQHFDVIVIGGQLAGRISAGLIARAGRRVLVIDQGESSPTYEEQGWLLPRHSLPAPNHEASAAIKNIHRSINFAAPPVVTGSEDTSLQIAIDRKRFKLHVDATARSREFTREIPDTVERSKAVWQSLTERDIEMDKYLAANPNLTPWGFFQSWLVRRQWQLQEASTNSQLNLEGLDILESVIEHPSVFFSYLQNPKGLGRNRLQGLYLTQTQCPRSMDKPFDTLLDKHLESLGVEFRRDKKIESIEVEKRRLTRLVLAADKKSYAADFFIANTAIDLDSTLPEPHASKGYLKKPERMKITGGVVTLNLVIHTQAIPQGLEKQLLLADAPTPLYLALSPAWRAGVALNKRHDPDHTVVSISQRIDDEALHNSENPQALGQVMIERLTQVAPFIQDHIVASSFSRAVDHLSASDKRDTRSLLVQPGYAPQTSAPLGIVGRNLRTRFKNLLHVGKDVLPGLGVEGEYLTGQAAAEQLQKLAKRKWQKQLKA
jgi:phytoene dehydrogenase-like protein